MPRRKRLTSERILELCGGPPTLNPKCSLCARRVGPYYGRVDAVDALAEHFRWRHEFTWPNSLREAAECLRTSQQVA